jgi:vacuolar-type H+-ATPase subunit I/STV1
MAIAKIKHIDIFFTKEHKEQLLQLIQKLGLIQLIQFKEIPTVTEEAPTWDLEGIQEAIDYLEGLSPQKGILSSKPILKEEEFDRLIKDSHLKLTIQHLRHLRDRLKNAQIELDKLSHTKNSLLPWQELRLALRDIAATRYVEFILGIVNRRQLLNLESDLKKDRLNLYFFKERERINLPCFKNL